MAGPAQNLDDFGNIRALQQSTDEDLNDGSDHADAGDFDFLKDIDEDKEIYRLKVFSFTTKLQQNTVIHQVIVTQ